MPSDWSNDEADYESLVLQGELLPKEDHSESNFTVTKSNSLIEAQYDLTAQEQKLLNSAIAKINPLGDYPDGIPEIRMTSREISFLTGIRQTNVYSFVRGAAERYHSIPIVKAFPVAGTTEERFEVINIAHKSKWDPDSGVFSIKFHSDIESELINLAQYTKYSLVRLKNLRSKYAIRLYELAQKSLRPKSTKPVEKKYGLDELRFYLGVLKGKSSAKMSSKKLYSSAAEFKRRVIDPAVVQVNENTDVFIEYKTYSKPGRKTIVGIHFKFRYLSASEKPSFETNQIRERLKEYFPESKLDYILDTYTQLDIKANLEYLAERESAGHEIKNYPAFIIYLLKYNIAALPDVANPFSRLYQPKSPEFEFVKLHILPNWFSIEEDVRLEMQKFGLKAKEIRPAVDAFKKACEETDPIKRHQFSTSAPVGSEQWQREFEEWAASPEMMAWGDEI